MVLMRIMATMEIMMNRSDLIEVLSFLPAFTSDMLSGLSTTRLAELYQEYFGN